MARIIGERHAQPIEILGSYWTLGVGADPLGDQRCLHDFRKRVEIAAQGGFQGHGFLARGHAGETRTLQLSGDEADPG